MSITDVERPTISITPEPTYLGAVPDDQLCHIVDDIDRTYCGAPVPREIHGTFRGEAVCPVCGSPTCPRCIQLLYLDLQLDDG